MTMKYQFELTLTRPDVTNIFYETLGLGHEEVTRFWHEAQKRKAMPKQLARAVSAKLKLGKPVDLSAMAGKVLEKARRVAPSKLARALSAKLAETTALHAIGKKALAKKTVHKRARKAA